ncbi:MAG TPA: hypothetical protein DDW24_07895 [Blastocatellia bacterium]|nr:hypothetical protein [Chloracidobacterium sp.]HBE82688.1 hypothetical protein [Blastocatellia bacterium]
MNSTDEQTEPRFVEGRDYYFENGLLVMTAEYLLRRGYCCGNRCRHCPYEAHAMTSTQSKNSSSSL